jgi:hypothetical protein
MDLGFFGMTQVTENGHKIRHMDCGSLTAATREVAKCKVDFIGSTGGQREHEWH